MEAAFGAKGMTYAIEVDTKPHDPVKIESINQATQYRVFNSGVSTIFILLSSTSEEARELAKAPEPGDSPAHSYPIAGNSVEVMSGPPNAFFVGVTISGTNTIYITAGEGL